MQRRPSSRLLVLDIENRVLLFRFEHRSGPLTGQVFWATPGGGVEDGESFADAALRELYEEVGIRVDDPGPQIAQRTTTFTLPTGEVVESDERYFLISTGDKIVVSSQNWTDLEREVFAAHRWWSQAELRSAKEQIWPENIETMLSHAAVWASIGQVPANGYEA